MSKKELTEFGKEVKLELILRGETQKWLIEQIRGRSGKFIDTSYLHKLMTGERNAPEIKTCIRRILNLSEAQH